MRALLLIGKAILTDLFVKKLHAIGAAYYKCAHVGFVYANNYSTVQIICTFAQTDCTNQYAHKLPK